jgi:putative ABC transport system permease protein
VSPVELWRLSGSALRAHKVRTRMTMAAVAIGVAAVLLLTSLGETARGYVLEQFGAIGSNLLIVTPGKVETSGGPPMAAAGTRDLTISDAEALRRQIPGVIDMAPISVGAMEASAGGRSRSTIIIGTTSRFIPLRRLRVAAGSNLPDVDPDQPVQACMVGAEISRELFGDASPLGKVLRLGEYRFRVVGVVGTEGQSINVNFDEVILAPVANVQRMINREGLFRVLLQMRSFEGIEAAKERVRDVLTHRHRQEDFTIITQQAVVDSLGDILDMLTMALTAIAAISLLVAGIGIMNVMLITVAERTPEIGLMKAVGATSGQVLAMFVAEAAVLALVGGAIGVGIGVVAMQVLGAAVPELPATTPVWAIEAALGVALGTGVIFGTLPAAKAARMHPVEALRSRR